MSFFVYCLQSSDRRATYVGATVDLDRRLRQHNKEIKGGATATGIHVARGNTWKRVAHVEGFPDWKSALQFEWRWKQLSRKKLSVKNPLERRIIGLKELLSLERSTEKAVAFQEWTTPPKIVMEDEEAMQYYSL